MCARGYPETGGASLVFVYEIWNEDSKSLLLCEGQTRHALTKWNSSRPPGARNAGMVQNLCLYGIVPEQ